MAASGEPLLPYPLNLVRVPSQSTTIARNAVIGKMATHHAAQMEMLFADCPMQVMPAPVTHRSQCAGKPVLRRGLPHYILSLPGPHPDMSEAKEVERCATRCRVAHSIRSLEAEVDEACLLGMQCKAIPRKTLAQHSQNPLGAEEVLERHHKIIGIPDKGTSPLESWPHLGFEPFIQHMVQINVREQWRDHAPLRRAFRRLAYLSFFHHASLQPFIDHPPYNTVGDPSVEELPQLLVGNRVEILAYINVEHPT